MNKKQRRLISLSFLVSSVISVGGVHALENTEEACKGCHDGYKNIPFLIDKSSAAAHHPANPDENSLIYQNLYSQCNVCHTTPTAYEKRCVNCHKPEIDGLDYPSVPFLKTNYLSDRHHSYVDQPIGNTGEVYECLSCHAMVANSYGEPELRDWAKCGIGEQPAVLPANFTCYK